MTVSGYGGSISMLARISLAPTSSAVSIAMRSAVGSTRTDSVPSSTGREGDRWSRIAAVGDRRRSSSWRIAPASLRRGRRNPATPGIAYPETRVDQVDHLCTNWYKAANSGENDFTGEVIWRQP